MAASFTVQERSDLSLAVYGHDQHARLMTTPQNTPTPDESAPDPIVPIDEGEVAGRQSEAPNDSSKESGTSVPKDE